MLHSLKWKNTAAVPQPEAFRRCSGTKRSFNAAAPASSSSTLAAVVLNTAFSALIWIFLEVQLSSPILQYPPLSLPSPPLYLVVMTLIVESNQAKSLTKEFSRSTNLMKSSTVISLASLISNCHLIFLSTFFPLVVFLCLSGLHPLQNSYCPGQRGDRLLLLEDDCPQRDQRWEWIPTSDRLLTLTFIFKCQPCSPPNPTFCFGVFFFLPPPKWENVLLSFQIPSVTIYSRLHHLGSVQPHSQLDASTYSPADFTRICPAAACRLGRIVCQKHLIAAVQPF